MSIAPFNRRLESLGNCINLGHINVQVPDQLCATSFYVSGLGLTRDPYFMTGLDNMWVNCGGSQFHLFGGPPQVVRGIVGLMIPDRAALITRLAAVRAQLDGTRFEFSVVPDFVDTVCPWGNRIRCHAPELASPGSMSPTMAYVEFDVLPGTAARIARFYDSILGAPSSTFADPQGFCAEVLVGRAQYLRFRETRLPEAAYDGHHVQLYVADFSGPHDRLHERGLITEESSPHQYRFLQIVDVESGEPIFAMEHEIRSLTHPFFGRPLLNRNPALTTRSYQPGCDAGRWVPR